MTKVFEGRKASFLLLDIRLYIGILGVLLSVILHEFFHIVVHWDSLVSIKLFPNIYTLVEVNSTTLHQYDTSLEELIAYSITLGVLLVTAIIITKISDTKDTRSFSDSLLPKHSEFKSLTDAELIELVHASKLFKSRV